MLSGHALLRAGKCNQRNSLVRSGGVPVHQGIQAFQQGHGFPFRRSM
jgi:hypothetical protein